MQVEEPLVGVHYRAVVGFAGSLVVFFRTNRAEALALLVTKLCLTWLSLAEIWGFSRQDGVHCL